MLSLRRFLPLALALLLLFALTDAAPQRQRTTTTTTTTSHTTTSTSTTHTTSSSSHSGSASSSHSGSSSTSSSHSSSTSSSHSSSASSSHSGSSSSSASSGAARLDSSASASSSVSRASSVSSASSASSASASASASASPDPDPFSVIQTALVIATDDTTAAEATGVLQAYAQPFELLSVPMAGVSLPTLETVDANNNSVGNFGLIIIIGLVSYDYGGTLGWQSAITTDQFTSLYNYQTKYGVRMIQLDSYPGNFPGMAVAPGPSGGCCDTDEQFVNVIDPTMFPTAGVKSAPVSTIGLWHYPAIITDPTNNTAFLEFAANTEYATSTVAGVIQNISGREQMVIFLAGGTWSLTTNFLAHTWFHWGYRGIYNGYRRVSLAMQVDDMFLHSAVWNVTTGIDPDGQRGRINTTDLQMHVDWIPEFVATLNPGSDWFIEIGINGNGNYDFVGTLNNSAAWSCPNPVDVNDPISPNVDAEWIKPLGTGVNMVPDPVVYNWTLDCLLMDPLASFFYTPANRDLFAWVSHTFTHEDLDNCTFYDANFQMSFNYIHAQLLEITQSTRGWANKSFIPPGITGVHNGDAIQAFWNNGIYGGVGDSTRPALVNQENIYWPLLTTIEENGFAGYTIYPRQATRIYYNCGNQYEDADEWATISPTEAAGTAGDIYALLQLEIENQVQRLITLQRAPFMFHQQNLRVADVSPTTINDVTKQRSLYQMWAETIAPAFTSLVDWPFVNIGNDDLFDYYTARMVKDQCNPTTQLLLSTSGNTTQITGFIVDCTGSTCPEPIPVTIPGGTVTNLQGSTTEQIGNDPLTLWVPLSGSPKTFTLTTPISLP